jgi:hypothetical protein
VPFAEGVDVLCLAALLLVLIQVVIEQAAGVALAAEVLFGDFVFDGYRGDAFFTKVDL